MSKRINRTQPSQPSNQRFLRGSASQPSPRSSQSSQSAPNQPSQNEETLHYLTNKVVRFFIFSTGSKTPVKRADLQQKATPNAGRNFEKIIKMSAKILLETYGYELMVCSSGSVKSYILKSVLYPLEDGDDENDEDDSHQPEGQHKIPIFLVLFHIFMLKGSCTDTSLCNFLHLFHIAIDGNHPIFGNVKDLLQSMIRQKYLSSTMNELGKKMYSWGDRAKLCVSKRELLDFAAKMNNNDVRIWTAQHADAEKQFAGENGTEGDTSLDEQ